MVLHAGADDASDEDMAANASDDSSDEDMAAKASDDDASDEDMAAAGRKSNDDNDSSDDDSSASDDDAYQAMEDLSLEDASQEPGEVNKDASNRGSKTKVTKPPKQGEHFSGNVAKGRIHGGKGNMKKPFGGMDAAAVKIERLYASEVKKNRKLVSINAVMVADANKKIKKLSTQNRTIMAQLERFSDAESRRSAMPIELVNLAAKSGVNLGELKANGEKLSVYQVDSMFAAAAQTGVQIGVQERIAMKMLMEEQGVMGQGVVDRGYGRIQ